GCERFSAALSIQRLVETFDKRIIAERFAEKPYSSRFKRSLSDVLGKEGSDEDDGESLSILDQASLQVETCQSGHVHVRNQTRRVVNLPRIKKSFSGGEGDDAKSQR